MDSSLIWLGFRGTDPARVHDMLGVRLTGLREELAQSPLSAVLQANGWYVVVDNTADERFSEQTFLARCSKGCELVTCFVDEDGTNSRAAGWSDGRRIWIVEHTSDEGPYHLHVEGRPPLELDAIEARLSAEQDAAGGEDADVDHLFDVPVELAHSVTGFSHDVDPVSDDDTGEPFQVLETTR